MVKYLKDFDSCPIFPAIWPNNGKLKQIVFERWTRPPMISQTWFFELFWDNLEHKNT